MSSAFQNAIIDMIMDECDYQQCSEYDRDYNYVCDKEARGNEFCPDCGCVHSHSHNDIQIENNDDKFNNSVSLNDYYNVCYHFNQDDSDYDEDSDDDSDDSDSKIVFRNTYALLSVD